MENFILIEPSKEWIEQIAAYRKEFLEAKSSMDGTGNLSKMENPYEWLEQVDNLKSGKELPPEWVISTQLMYVREKDKKLVGMIQIRHYFNSFLEKFGGNLGYSVLPSERKKGYATQMLQKTLPLCKKIGLDKILITCLSDNEGSRKVILANGGIFESVVYDDKNNRTLERYWIDLKINNPYAEHRGMLFS